MSLLDGVEASAIHFSMLPLRRGNFFRHLRQLGVEVDLDSIAIQMLWWWRVPIDSDDLRGDCFSGDHSRALIRFALISLYANSYAVCTEAFIVLGCDLWIS